MSRATGVGYAKGTFTRARRRYEETKTSFAKLALYYNIPKTVLVDVAQRQGWVKFDPDTPELVAEAEVATRILVSGLEKKGGPAPPEKRKRGRVKGASKYLRMKEADVETPEQRRLNAARAEFENGNTQWSALAKKYHFSVGKLRYAAKMAGWAEPPVPPPAAAPEVAPDPPPKPDAAPKGWSAVKAASDVRTADIIDFPGVSQSPPRKNDPVELLPEPSSQQRTELRMTLAAIRAAMSVEQVQRLDHHMGLLRRYSHLLEVYLEPHRYVDTEGLSKDELAEKVVSTQKVALRMLLPSERDTLAGAIKVMTESLRVTIAMQRTVAGLERLGAGALRRPGAPGDGDPLAEDEKQPRIIDVDALTTEDLSAVQYAMEMVDRHHRKNQEPPKPPPPAPIDDLLGPEPVVVKEPEEEEAPR